MADSIREVQDVILDIYKNIKKICERNKIRYFAIGGTCIGAVRHNGFIPWDDDLDIAMPDSDYKRFIEIAPVELPDYLELRHPRDIPTAHRMEIKVCNKNTTLVEPNEIKFPVAYKGIYVDVMPLCGFPENNKQRNLFCDRLKQLRMLNYLRRRPFANVSDFQSFFKWLLCVPLKITKNDFWYNKWVATAFRFGFDESNYTGYVWSGKIGDKLIFKRELFSDFRMIKFEDTFMPCPIGYDEMLKQQFGNYMQIPKEEERRYHSFNGILDVNKSYLEYKNKLEGRK